MTTCRRLAITRAAQTARDIPSIGVGPSSRSRQTRRSLQSIIAAAPVPPIVLLVSAGLIPVSVANWPMLIGVVLLAALVAGCRELVIGPSSRRRRSSRGLSLVVPATLLGCTHCTHYLRE